VSANSDNHELDDRVQRDEALVKQRADEIEQSPDGDHRRRAAISKVERYLTGSPKKAASASN
jgi:hypothetical protein